MAEVRIHQTNGKPRLAVRGEVDLADYDRLDATLRRVEAAAPPVVTIDLREVSYIDSTGVRWLVEADGRARETGRRVVVVYSAAEAVDHVLQLCRLEDVLDLVDAPAPH